MARGQGQRMSGAPTTRMNNMVVTRQQQQNQAMAQTHQSTVTPIMYIPSGPYQYYGNNNPSYYGNKQTVSILRDHFVVKMNSWEKIGDTHSHKKK